MAEIECSLLYDHASHPWMYFGNHRCCCWPSSGHGFIFAQRRYREEAILAACIICSYFVILSGYYMWWGGYAVGARHIIPALPFFCLFLVFVPKKLNWPFVGLEPRLDWANDNRCSQHDAGP